MKAVLRFLAFDPDRRGNERYYVRINGRKIRIRETFRDGEGEITREFMTAYWAAIATLKGEAAEAAKPAPPREDTFDWFFDQYFRSAKFAGFDKATKADKRSVLLRFAETAGSLPFRKFRQEDMVKSQQKRAATPGAADKLVKVLRAVYNWGMAQKPPLVSHNPAANVSNINVSSEGFHTWAPEEIDQYRAFHPIGSKPRLAMEIMINVGARLSDACSIGMKNETTIEGHRGLSFTAYKNRNRYPSRINAKITPELKQALVKTKIGAHAYLVTSFGKPFTINGLGNKMREWCDEAGLPQCSSHGLRKAAAVMFAESGASAPELCVVFGWSNLKTAQIYIKKANDRRMSMNAFDRRTAYFKQESVSLSGTKIPNETSEEKRDG